MLLFLPIQIPWFNEKCLMLSKEQFCCNFVSLFFLPSPWRAGQANVPSGLFRLHRKLWWPIVLDLCRQLRGWPLVSEPALVTRGWALDKLDVLPWLPGAKQCYMWQKCMETWHFVSTGQKLALFPPLKRPFHCISSEYWKNRGFGCRVIKATEWLFLISLQKFSILLDIRMI